MRETWILAAVVVGLSAADLAVRWGSGTPVVADDLPSLPAIPAQDVARIELVQGTEHVVLEQQDGWVLSLPVEGRADAALVAELLEPLANGVRFDARVDAGNVEDYGLKSGAAIRVGLSGAFGATVFYVGRDVAGGTTYLRFPDDEQVYRANLGGRRRFWRNPSDWRE